MPHPDGPSAAQQAPGPGCLSSTTTEPKDLIEQGTQSTTRAQVVSNEDTLFVLGWVVKEPTVLTPSQAEPQRLTRHDSTYVRRQIGK